MSNSEVVPQACLMAESLEQIGSDNSRNACVCLVKIEGKADKNGCVLASDGEPKLLGDIGSISKPTSTSNPLVPQTSLLKSRTEPGNAMLLSPISITSSPVTAISPKEEELMDNKHEVGADELLFSTWLEIPQHDALGQIPLPSDSTESQFAWPDFLCFEETSTAGNSDDQSVSGSTLDNENDSSSLLNEIYWGSELDSFMSDLPDFLQLPAELALFETETNAAEADEPHITQPAHIISPAMTDTISMRTPNNAPLPMFPDSAALPAVPSLPDTDADGGSLSPSEVEDILANLTAIDVAGSTTGLFPTLEQEQDFFLEQSITTKSDKSAWFETTATLVHETFNSQPPEHVINFLVRSICSEEPKHYTGQLPTTSTSPQYEHVTQSFKGPSYTASPVESTHDQTSTDVEVLYANILKTRRSLDSLYHCPIPSCNKGFTRRYNLKTHFGASHALIKPFPCDLCEGSFARKYDLQRHVEQKHQDRGVEGNKRKMTRDDEEGSPRKRRK